jgi:hypothetical protein
MTTPIDLPQGTLELLIPPSVANEPQHGSAILGAAAADFE